VILVVNAGSTSLKLSIVDEDGSATKVGSFEEIDAALEGVAHRVVHGGQRFIEPVVVDGAVEREIIELETIAPLHNGPALEGLTRAREAFPDVPHIAVFDTAFHHTIPAEASTYALPAEWREWGIRRFGFHGLSVEWSTQRAAELLGRDAGTRLVVCHLGGGCSVTAVRDGRSVDTTMGFSPLEGIPMTTRSGSIDPAIVFYVMRVHGLTADAAEHALNFESGIEGLAPGHGGTRAVERAAAAGDEPARLAVGVFVHRLTAAIAAMAAAAGGIDALVFTGGIGEHSASIRAGSCASLGFLGLSLDAGLNASPTLDCDVAASESAVRILLIAAREDVVAARAARAVLRPGRRTDALQ
jgi:acetate kinase